MEDGMPIENKSGYGNEDAKAEADAIGRKEETGGENIYATEQEYREHLKETGDLTRKHADDDAVSFRFKKYHVDTDTADVNVFGFDGRPTFAREGVAREKFEEIIAMLKNPEGQRGKIESLLNLEIRNKKDKKKKKNREDFKKKYAGTSEFIFDKINTLDSFKFLDYFEDADNVSVLVNMDNVREEKIVSRERFLGIKKAVRSGKKSLREIFNTDAGSMEDVLEQENPETSDGTAEPVAVEGEKQEKQESREFSEIELRFMAEYEKDVRYMLKFIADIDYVGQFGYEKDAVSGAIVVETERYWKLLENEMSEEGYFKDAERVGQVIGKLRSDLDVQKEQVEKEPENNQVIQSGTVKEESGENLAAVQENIPGESAPERIFDINNKEQQIEMIKEGKIYYAEMQGREKNLETAFTEFEKDNQELLANYRDKDILLKVNLVDPDSPHACTDPETIKKIIEMIGKYGPKKIYIGDVPSAMGKKGRDWDDLKKIYESNLGYDFGATAELINLEGLENETIEEGGESFQTKKLDQFGGIINISRPKMHGQFGFTGCTKNLMGFMTQDSRDASIHMRRDNEYAAQEANARLGKFSEAMLKNRPDMINITDGTDFIIGHEHLGIPKKTDFALVSRDPFNSDHEMLKLLGLNKDRVSYLENKTYAAADGKLSGSMERSQINPSGLEQKLMVNENRPDGNANFVYVINDPEFLDNPETKKRYIAICMERMKKIVVDHLRNQNIVDDDRCSVVMKNSVIGKTAEQVFDNLFADDTYEESRRSNPYNNGNIPEFEKLAIEWINNQKL